jgi:glycosyltransferase involved in cell wall biosynthesis
VITQARAQLSALGIEPKFVVSDDSSDGTAELARSMGALVVPGGGQGLGRAYVSGLKKCVELGVDRIFLLDGDGQADLAELSRFIMAMDDKSAGLVTGSRFLGPSGIDYRYPLINRAGAWMLAAYLSCMTGQRFSDSHGGLRLMTAEVAQTQKIYGTHTYVQESIVDAVSRGFRVVEIPSCWHVRKHGHSRVVHSTFRYARRTGPYLLLRLGRKILRMTG